jgi:hypothetical protein
MLIGNNPLNLRPMLGGKTWDGQAAGDAGVVEIAGIGAFCKFNTVVNGFRAAAKNVWAYKRVGWVTPAQIITHWAPSTENNTAAYIAHVKELSGLDMDAPLPLTPSGALAYDGMYPLLWAMAQHEQGVKFDKLFKPEQLNQGLRLAGVGDVPTTGVHAVIATVGGVASGAAALAPDIQGGLNAIGAPVNAIPSPTLHTVYNVLLIVGGAIAAYGTYRRFRSGGSANTTTAPIPASGA